MSTAADDDDGYADALAAYRNRRGGPKNYNADTGIRTGHRQNLTPTQFDTLLVQYHNAGYSTRTIGKALGITHQGVSKALKRIAAGGFGKARDARHG
jgi:hypothetical protein